MAIFIDRTSERGKNAKSRMKYINRIKDSIKQSINDDPLRTERGHDKLRHGKIDVTSIDLVEPFFTFDTSAGSPFEVVLRNESLNKGDEFFMQYPHGRSGSSSQAGDGEDGEMAEGLLLSEAEYASLLFDDLELPDFIEKDLKVIDDTKFKRAGYVKYGNPSNLNIYKSYTTSFARRIAVLSEYNLDIEKLKENEEENKLLIEELERKKNNILWMDPVDLRYNVRVPVEHKVTGAVIFFIMDVSGSMQESMRSVAYKFFYFLYLFIKQKYEKTDMVFITHTDTAEEVSQTDFFYSKRSGGTRFKNAYEKTAEIIRKKYPPSKYNIYVAHVSDSDTTENDFEESCNYLKNVILPSCQCMFYLHSHPDNPYFSDSNIAKKVLEFFRKFISSNKFKFSTLISESDAFEAMRTFFKRK